MKICTKCGKERKTSALCHRYEDMMAMIDSSIYNHSRTIKGFHLFRTHKVHLCESCMDYVGWKILSILCGGE